MLLVATKPIAAPQHVGAGEREPAGDIVQRAPAKAREQPVHLGTLRRRLILGPDEGRVAQHIAALRGVQHLVPHDFQRIGVADRGRDLQRDARERRTEYRAQPHIHDVVHHPQCNLGDARRKFLDLDAVEAIDVQFRQRGDVELGAAAGQPVHAADDAGMDFAQQFHFQGAELAIGDDQEIPATAGGIQEPQRRQPIVKSDQCRLPPGVAARLEAGELGPQLIQEQRADHLQNVRLGGVVGTDGAALLSIHHALEQGAENRRADP